LCRAAADEHLDQVGAERVRVLLECQPERRPPALEPGARAPDRGVQQAPDAHLQRLPRSGGASLPEHGFEEILLAAAPQLMVSNKVVIGIKVAVHLASLLPLAWLAYGAYSNDLGANPLHAIT